MKKDVTKNMFVLTRDKPTGTYDNRLFRRMLPESSF